MGPRMRLDLIRTAHLRLHLVRGIVPDASSLCFFSGFATFRLPKRRREFHGTDSGHAEAACVIRRAAHREPRWAFVAAGFLGMFLIVRPGSEMLTPAGGAPRGWAAALYATFQILTRKLAGENLRC